MMVRLRAHVLVGVLCLIAASASADSQPLTPEEAIATTRILGERGHVLPSPSGERYALALVTGDMERDGNWLTVMVGGLESLQAAEPRAVARMFGRSLGAKYDIYKSYVTLFGRLLWVDDERIAFFWEDDNGLVQLYITDARSGEVTQLTDHPTSLGIMTLGINDDDELIYAALANDGTDTDEKYRKMILEGFAAEYDEPVSLMAGLPVGIDRVDLAWGYEWFHKRPGRPPSKITVDGRAKTRFLPITGATISPGGRLAILGTSPPREVSPDWLRYSHATWLPGIEAALEGREDDLLARQLTQLYVVDLETRSSRPLWNAITMSQGTEFAWSPDGKRVLIGPTFLPPDGADQAGLEGNGVAEVAIDSGRFWPIPVELEAQQAIEGLRWISPSEVEVTTPSGILAFRKSRGGWKPVPMPEGARTSTARVKVEMRTGLNAPTVLVAVDPLTGNEREVLDPNPGLKARFKLGRVEKAEWTAVDDRTWQGELYYPADYESGKRYPFVIQTNGYGSSSFSLYGQPEFAGSGPGVGVYIAQLLAGQNIGVLQIRNQSSVARDEWAEVFMHGFDAAARFLIEQDLAEPEQIGLQGFSRTGWATQYTLVNSSFLYAAAIAADNIEGGYVENILVGDSMEAENGGAPHGAVGLKNWLEKAPPFSAGRIRTPLLKMVQAAGAINHIAGHWELFARLRRQGKPVELYVMPDVQEHGAHNPQNPRQVAALQHRALDWWLFWLKGEEDPSAAKAQQYASWRKMREQRQEVLEQDRPPQLEWTAAPVSE